MNAIKEPDPKSLFDLYIELVFRAKTYWFTIWLFYVCFFGAWFRIMIDDGFLQGLLIGWIPALFFAGLFAFFWPIIFTLVGVWAVADYLTVHIF